MIMYRLADHSIARDSMCARYIPCHLHPTHLLQIVLDAEIPRAGSFEGPIGAVAGAQPPGHFGFWKKIVFVFANVMPQMFASVASVGQDLADFRQQRAEELELKANELEQDADFWHFKAERWMHEAEEKKKMVTP